MLDKKKMGAAGGLLLGISIAAGDLWVCCWLLLVAGGGLTTPRIQNMQNHLKFRSHVSRGYPYKLTVAMFKFRGVYIWGTWKCFSNIGPEVLGPIQAEKYVNFFLLCLP